MLTNRILEQKSTVYCVPFPGKYAESRASRRTPGGFLLQGHPAVFCPYPCNRRETVLYLSCIIIGRGNYAHFTKYLRKRSWHIW